MIIYALLINFKLFQAWHCRYLSAYSAIKPQLTVHHLWDHTVWLTWYILKIYTCSHSCLWNLLMKHVQCGWHSKPTNDVLPTEFLSFLLETSELFYYCVVSHVHYGSLHEVDRICCQRCACPLHTRMLAICIDSSVHLSTLWCRQGEREIFPGSHTATRFQAQR